MPKRNKALDLAKAVSLLCIIAGHSGQDLIFKLVFTFHVPIFLLISGYLYRDRKGALAKRARVLLKAYCFTVAAVIVLDLLFSLGQWLLGMEAALAGEIIKKWLLAGLYGSGARTDCFGLRLPAIGAIWFLLALLWGLGFLHLLLRIRCAEWVRAVLVLLIFLLGWLSAKATWLPFSIQSGMSSLLFLYIGYSYKQHEEKFKRVNEAALALLCLAAWGVSIWSSLRIGPMRLVISLFPSMLINVAGACGGSYFIILVLKRIEKLPFRALDALALWGQGTLAGLSFHLIEMNTFPWRALLTDAVPTYVSLAAILVGKLLWVSFGIYLSRKNRFLKKVFSS